MEEGEGDKQLNNQVKKAAVVTGTRAECGLLYAVLKAIGASLHLRLSLVVRTTGRVSKRFVRRREVSCTMNGQPDCHAAVTRGSRFRWLSGLKTGLAHAAPERCEPGNRNRAAEEQPAESPAVRHHYSTSG